MSDNTTNTPQTPTPAVNPEDVVAQLRAIRQTIPDYGQVPLATRKTMRSAAAVSVHFVNASINTVGASSLVQTAVGRTPEDLLQESNDIARWSAVEDELHAMLKGVAATNLVRRHRLGLTSLQTYGITRQLARKPENADLLPHLSIMQSLNRLGRRKKAPDQTPSPNTVPAKTIQE